MVVVSWFCGVHNYVGYMSCFYKRSWNFLSKQIKSLEAVMLVLHLYVRVVKCVLDSLFILLNTSHGSNRSDFYVYVVSKIHIRVIWKMSKLVINYYFISTSSYDCQCGRDLQWHKDHQVLIRESDLEYSPHKELWHHKTHTEATTTESFGVIQFNGFGQDVHTSPVSIWNINKT